MNIIFTVTVEEGNMIVTALSELLLKATPSVIRNNLIVKLQQQAASAVASSSENKG